MLKWILVCCFLSLAIGLFAQQVATGKVSDGPYLFYTDGFIVSKTVVEGNVVTDSVPIAGKEKFHFKVMSGDNKRPGFSVRLRELSTEPSNWKAPGKMLILSDIEGEFAGFRQLLIGNGVMDSAYSWTFGKGHVVVCGDLFDRGEGVTELLWLLYKLDGDAIRAGGYVHTVLGNHDLMNMYGDVRYVRPKYLEVARLLGRDYVSLFGADSELGRWLRTKNIIERGGDNLFLHGGISPEVNAMGLSVDGINALVRPFYGVPLKSLPGSVSVFFSGKSSPFWFRGYFPPKSVVMGDVDRTLSLFGVKRVVVGHTIAEKNIAWWWEKKVLGVDVDRHAGRNDAVLVENGKWFEVDASGRRREIDTGD